MIKTQKEQKMHTKNLKTIFVIGIIAAIAFILIQPFFGMLTLTSRHASAYVNIGNYSETAALILSWFVHISVSVFYAFISSVIFSFNSSSAFNTGQVVILGWLTTLTATPANEWVVKFVTKGRWTELSSLSALNTQIGPKLWLHILFFALVVGLLMTAKRFNRVRL